MQSEEVNLMARVTVVLAKPTPIHCLAIHPQKQIEITSGPSARNVFSVYTLFIWSLGLPRYFTCFGVAGQGPRTSYYLIFCYQPWYLSDWSFDDVPSSFLSLLICCSVLIIWLMLFRGTAQVTYHKNGVIWMLTDPPLHSACPSPLLRSLCPLPSFLLLPF